MNTYQGKRSLSAVSTLELQVLTPGYHLIVPFITVVRRISTALHTQEVDVDVITRGGTPTSIKVGYTARVVDVKAALINVENAFATLRASVISVVSGAANSYTIDQLAQNKNEISEAAQEELLGLSQKHGWGLGDFQVAVGDPSLSDELKKLLMREEAVRRESAANLEKARHQVSVAQQLLEVAKTLESSPFARELLRMQVLGAVFGLALYLINFYVVTGAFPWFAELRGWSTLITHLIFGVSASLLYW